MSAGKSRAPPIWGVLTSVPKRRMPQGATVDFECAIASGGILRTSYGAFCASSCIVAAAWLLRRPLKRLLILFLIVLTSMTALHAQDAAVRIPKVSHEIIARGIIGVAITRFDLPAFHWRTPSGELAGPEIELERLLGRMLKVGVNFRGSSNFIDTVGFLPVAGEGDSLNL